MPNRTPGAPIVEEIVEEHVTPTPAAPPPPIVPKGARRVVQVYEDEEDEDDDEDGIVGADGYRTVIVKHPKQRNTAPPPRPTPKRWFGGRF